MASPNRGNAPQSALGSENFKSPGRYFQREGFILFRVKMDANHSMDRKLARNDFPACCSRSSRRRVQLQFEHAQGSEPFS
jgi:hypothetical protein